MQELHDFDLHELKLRLNLNYYQQVKLINYIRRQVIIEFFSDHYVVDFKLGIP